jgi:hypothetical protein
LKKGDHFENMCKQLEKMNVEVLVQVAIWSTVQQSYGLGVEGVQVPFGHRRGAPVSLAVR